LVLRTETLRSALIDRLVLSNESTPTSVMDRKFVVYEPSFNRQESKEKRSSDQAVQCDIITLANGVSPVMNKTISSLSQILPSAQTSAPHAEDLPEGADYYEFHTRMA